VRESTRRMITLAIIILLLVGTIATISAFVENIPDLQDEEGEEEEENGNGEGDNGEGDNGDEDNGEGDNGDEDNGEGDNGDEDNGDEDDCCGPGGGDKDATGGESTSPEGSYPSDESLFYVEGAQDTNYLKNSIGINYTGERWLLGEVSKEEYDGGLIEHEVSNYSEKKENDIDIIPIKEFSPGFIPVSTYTDKVDNATFMEEDELFYYPEPNIFRSDTNFTESYSFSTTKYEFDGSTLISADVIEDPQYYQLPDNVTDRTIQLAESITEGIDSKYEKAEAIEQYLKEEYIYDFDYNISPEDHEPVDWFLFEEERGVCANFNSAFVVLARAVDVPARRVSGYRIEGTESKQEVKASSAHAWAEVGLEEAWITFDATPLTGYDDLLETQTNITSINPEFVQRGENVTVKGEVEAVEGYEVTVDQMPINIYLKENETQIGEGVVKEGEFAINCTIPSEVSVGEYDIIAKSITDNRFIGSWSNESSENPTSFDREKLIDINQEGIIIISDTEIKLDLINRTYLEDEVELSGKLVDDEGDNLTEKDIAVSVEGSYHQNLTTDENGTFSTNLTFQDTGNYTIEVVFNGTDFYENSSAEGLIEIRELFLEYSTPERVFRGEDLAIEGEVFLNSTPIKPIAEKEVIIGLDAEDFNLYTLEGGFFGYSYLVEREREVGNITIIYNLTATDLVKSQEVKICSRTNLTLESIDKTHSGDEVNVSGRLVDDLGGNLTHKEVAVVVEDDYEQNLTTDKNGTFSTELSFQETGNYTIEVFFNGTDFYENTKDSMVLQVYSNESLLDRSLNFLESRNMFFLLPLIIGLSSVGYAWKKGYLQKIFSSLLSFKTSMETTTTTAQADQTNQALSQIDYLPEISLPEIDDRLPNVWGVDDELVIEAKGKFLIDGRKVESDDKEDQKKRFIHSFTKKGEHKIKAVGPRGEHQETVNLRIVEYREEIKDEYRDLLEELSDKGFEVDKKTTPRKLQKKLGGISIDERYLKDITRSFERAKYSILDLSRDDYENLMYGKIEVEKRLERKKETS